MHASRLGPILGGLLAFAACFVLGWRTAPNRMISDEAEAQVGTNCSAGLCYSDQFKCISTGALLCSADGGGGGGGSQFVGWYDGGSGAIQTAGGAVVIDAAGDSSQKGYSKSTQVELTGSGVNGGVVFQDTEQLVSASPSLRPLIAAPYSLIPAVELRSATSHWTAFEWNGSTLSPDVGPAPTSTGSVFTTGANGPYLGGLRTNGRAVMFEWAPPNNPMAFSHDGGFTMFAVFDTPPNLATGVNVIAVDDGIDFGGRDYNQIWADGLGQFQVQLGLSDAGGETAVVSSAPGSLYPNAVTAVCAGVGPDGGTSIIKTCGTVPYNSGGQSVGGVPTSGWGGSQPSVLIVEGSTPVYEFAVFDIPATESYCTRLCQETLQLPSRVLAVGDSQTSGVDNDSLEAEPYPFLAQGSLGNGYQFWNAGIPGSTGSECLGEWESNRYLSWNFASWLCGINDFNADTDGGAVPNVETSFSIMEAQALADGIKFVAFTSLPDGANANPDGGACVTVPCLDVINFNAFVRAQAANPNVIVIDSFSVFNNASLPNSMIPVYSSADLLHPSVLGYQVLGQLYASAISSGLAPDYQNSDAGFSLGQAPISCPYGTGTLNADGGGGFVCLAQSTWSHDGIILAGWQQSATSAIVLPYAGYVTKLTMEQNNDGTTLFADGGMMLLSAVDTVNTVVLCSVIAPCAPSSPLPLTFPCSGAVAAGGAVSILMGQQPDAGSGACSTLPPAVQFTVQGTYAP